jgi:hypothetical protein
MPLKTAGTDIETSPGFDRQWYRVQKVLQVLLTLTIAAGLAGVFGGGWLSTSTVRIGALEVTSERFVRKSVPFKIKIHPVAQIRAENLKLTVGRELMDRAGILRTIPIASSSAESVDGTNLKFSVSSSGWDELTIAVQPDRFGIFDWTLKVTGIGEASLFQIIYP